MKYIICLLGLIAVLQAKAIPSVPSLSPTKVTSLVTVPGYSGSIALAARIEFSNDCVASNSIVSSYRQDIASVTVFSAEKPNDIVCSMAYEPVGKWAIVAQNVLVGTTVTVNSNALSISEPEPAICTMQMCPTGRKDPYTCACESDFINN